MWTYHIIAFSVGVILDWIVGDPYSFPHPIKWIGSFIGWLDHVFMDSCIKEEWRNSKKEKWLGLVTLIIVCFVTILLSFTVIAGAYVLHPYAGIVVEAVLTCYVLAAKSLCKESMKVYEPLKQADIEGARRAVSMIVGRDTNSLDAKGITKAAVETVAENTSDGVIAPLIYTFIGGPILGLLYKAINTMDSMLGYKNERYENFGYFPAKTDDVVNFIPARISALAMILAAFIIPDCSGKSAIKIFIRDRYNHKSPNSAQTESVCAGALELQLAGDASYFGKVVKKPYIGDPVKSIEAEHIKKANSLMFMTEGIVLVFLIMLTLF